MFRHDLSEFDSLLPHADGTFRSDRLDMAFSEPDWAPYLLTRGDSPQQLADHCGCFGGLIRLAACLDVWISFNSPAEAQD
ncbi:hypothetical protein [Streptomyces pseudogriseolus]|uniref:hypothetical protein n=1 Tax=Streptomyces pseudogriseolus TaxID=36817 RepID=UPI003FA200B4